MLGINPAFQIYGFVLLVYFSICSAADLRSRAGSSVRLAATGQRAVGPNARRGVRSETNEDKA